MILLTCTILSLFATDLTLEEKVGQLLMTSIYPEELDEEPDTYLEKYKPGHLLFVGNGWDYAREKRLIDRYQDKNGQFNKVPIIFAQDLEWGLSMRLKEVPIYPKNFILTDYPNEEVYKIGQKIGAQCREIGIHLNLAPVVDVYNNPANTFLKERSFGSDPHKVAEKGSAMMRGLQSQGIKTCAKHFPGHGNTGQDSHLELPFLTQNYDALKKIELIPFKRLIDEGVDSIMTAHISLPEVDPKAEAASLSALVIKQILQQDLGFKGLVISDDLLMGALSHLSYEEIAVQAFLAGNDILLFTNYSPNGLGKVRTALERAHGGLVEAVKNGTIQESDLNRTVDKILKFKRPIFFGVGHNL